MLGSVNAPEPGFRPGARWGLWRAGVLARVGGSGMRWGLVRAGGLWRMLGALACAGGLWYASGVPACAGGSGMRWGLRHALAGSGARRGFGVPWRLTRSRLCLGWCCGLRVVAGLPVCGAARGGERHVLLRSYVVGVHWMRAYACVALGEWRTDAASEEVYVGAGGGIASVA